MERAFSLSPWPTCQGQPERRRPVVYKITVGGTRAFGTLHVQLANFSVKPVAVRIKCDKGDVAGQVQLLGGAKVMAQVAPWGSWRREPPAASLRGVDFGKDDVILHVILYNNTSRVILYNVGVYGGWGIEGNVSPVFIEPGEFVKYTFSNVFASGF